MATSNPDTIKVVREELEGAESYRLYIDGGPRATLTVARKPKEKIPNVSLEIDVAGDFPWVEARVLVMGLVKLAEVGNKLTEASTDVEQLLHTPTAKEIQVATAKAKAKQAKVDAKTKAKSKVPGEKRESAAQMFQDLILEGKLTDDKIFEKVAAKFGLDQKKRSYVAWYRNKLTKDGKKPPAAKE